jgi:hypothetical protein
MEAVTEGIELFGDGRCKVEFQVLLDKLVAVGVCEGNGHSIGDKVMLVRLS